MKHTLTQRQADVLSVIREAGEVGPSYDEIAASLGIGKTQVHAAVHALVARGRLVKPLRKQRCFVVKD